MAREELEDRMTRALEKWLGDGLETAFTETEEEKREREASEEFGKLIEKALVRRGPEIVQNAEIEQADRSNPFADLPLSWIAQE